MNSGTTRRRFLGAVIGSGAAALGCRTAAQAGESGALSRSAGKGGAVLVGSANALPGMNANYTNLLKGADPLDVAIDVVKVVEANPDDASVGLGGLPNEDGVVQLDAACMHGPTHNSGAVACIENILHPSEVARLVMERTDHCMIVGPGAYRFARMHGHPHTELLTDKARRRWLRWKENMSERDDRLSPRKAPEDERGVLLEGVREVEDSALAARDWQARVTGTIHCSALSVRGEVACTTTTSGLSWKIPGRIGDSPIIGAGLYCDQEAGSAGATGRGEAAILSTGSAAIVEQLRLGKTPLDAGLEVLRRIVRQVQRQATWQPGLLGDRGRPSFGLKFYIVDLDGKWAGVSLKGGGKFSVADGEGGPRHEELVPLFDD